MAPQTRGKQQDKQGSQKIRRECSALKHVCRRRASPVESLSRLQTSAAASGARSACNTRVRSRAQHEQSIAAADVGTPASQRHAQLLSVYSRPPRRQPRSLTCSAWTPQDQASAQHGAYESFLRGRFSGQALVSWCLLARTSRSRFEFPVRSAAARYRCARQLQVSSLCRTASRRSCPTAPRRGARRSPPALNHPPSGPRPCWVAACHPAARTSISSRGVLSRRRLRRACLCSLRECVVGCAGRGCTTWSKARSTRGSSGRSWASSSLTSSRSWCRRCRQARASTGALWVHFSVPNRSPRSSQPDAFAHLRELAGHTTAAWFTLAPRQLHLFRRRLHTCEWRQFFSKRKPWARSALITACRSYEL